MNWLALIISLPTTTATVRMRTWPALKQSGCAMPRDGVYSLPAETTLATVFSEQARAVRAGGGRAYVAQISHFEAEDEQRLVALFDRSQEYIALIERAALLQRGLPSVNANALRRNLRNLQLDLGRIAAIDFFPSPARDQATAAVADVTAAAGSGYSRPASHGPSWRRLSASIAGCFSAEHGRREKICGSTASRALG